MNLCDYGCGREGKFLMSSGRWCCCKYAQSCPGFKEKHCIGKNNPMYNRKQSEKTKEKISKRTKGRVPWNVGVEPYNKGKTLEELHGVKKAREIKEKRSRSISKRIKEGKCTPYYNYRFFNGYYHSLKNRDSMYTASAYELALCHYLERCPMIISFKRCKLAIPYVFEGVTRHYHPDFEAEDKELGTMIIEVKAEYEIDEPINKAKFDAAIKYCLLNGMVFYVSTEKQLRPMINLIYEVFGLVK